MNTKHLFFLLAAIVSAACSQIEEPIEGVVPVSLSCTTVSAVESKAAQNLNEGTFASGENVKVCISNTGANAWTDYMFTTAAAGAMTAPNPGPYYPAGSQNIDIVAYYPYDAGTSFSVFIDQTADVSYKASDLMFASVTNQAKQAEAVNLAFSHKMAKLCVNISAGQGVSSINSVSILNVKPTVSFNQATGAVGQATGTAVSIAMSNNGAALIPAQTINGGLLSIVTDKGTATYSVSNKAFSAGQLYTLNITVNLRAVGTTTEITGWTSEGTVTVNPVSNDKTPAGLEAVDLGLPSGLKWANMNIGAETETDYGTYFAWGETVGYTVIGATSEAVDGNLKEYFAWSTYSFCRGSDQTLSKYVMWLEDGFADNKSQLEPCDDAATVNWGKWWHMPTQAQCEELIDKCSVMMTTRNGVYGLLATSKINGNSIFLPAAGYRYDDMFRFVGEDGCYWSSSLTLFPFEEYHMNIPSYSGAMIKFGDSHLAVNGYTRAWGLPVRPVYVDPPKYVKEVKLIGGDEATTEALKTTYRNMGWTVINYDLNKGCGSSSDYIYLMYKLESCVSGHNNDYISGFIVKDNNDSPSGFEYDGRQYKPVSCDGTSDFIDSNGDLNNNAEGKDIHLFFTTAPFPDNRAVTAISFNSTKDGGVGLPDSSAGYDLNAGAGGDYIYMHFNTATCPY